MFRKQMLVHNQQLLASSALFPSSCSCLAAHPPAWLPTLIPFLRPLAHPLLPMYQFPLPMYQLPLPMYQICLKVRRFSEDLQSQLVHRGKEGGMSKEGGRKAGKKEG